MPRVQKTHSLSIAYAVCIQSLPAMAPMRPTVPAPVRGGGGTTKEELKEEDSTSDSNESEKEN